LASERSDFEQFQSAKHVREVGKSGNAIAAQPLPYQSTRCHINSAADAVKSLGKKYGSTDCSCRINGSLDSIGVVAVGVACNRRSRAERRSSKSNHTFGAKILSVEDTFHVKCGVVPFVPLVLINNLH
jgi:hypothetical protein